MQPGESRGEREEKVHQLNDQKVKMKDDTVFFMFRYYCSKNAFATEICMC